MASREVKGFVEEAEGVSSSFPDVSLLILVAAEATATPSFNKSGAVEGEMTSRSKSFFSILAAAIRRHPMTRGRGIPVVVGVVEEVLLFLSAF